MPRPPRAQRFLADPHALLEDPAYQRMSLPARGTYATLYLAGWDQKDPGVYVADDRVLAQLARVTPQEWSQNRDEVSQAFDTESRPGVWVLHYYHVTHLAQTKKLRQDRKRKREQRLRDRAKAPTSQRDVTEQSRVTSPYGSGSGTGSGSGAVDSESESKAGADAPQVLASGSPPQAVTGGDGPHGEYLESALARDFESNGTDQILTTSPDDLPLPDFLRGEKFPNTLRVRPPAKNGSRALGDAAAIKSILPELAEVTRYAGSDATRIAIALCTRLAKAGLTHPRVLVRIAKHYVEHRADMRNPWAYYNPGGHGFEAIKLTLHADQAFEEHEAIKQAELAWKGHGQ